MTNKQIGTLVTLTGIALVALGIAVIDNARADQFMRMLSGTFYFCSGLLISVYGASRLEQ